MQITTAGGCGCCMCGCGTGTLLLLKQPPGLNLPLPLNPQLLLLALLLGPIDEPSEVLTPLAAHDGMGPDDRRQYLLPPSVLHQLAGAVEHHVARCHPVAPVGLGEKAGHPPKVLPIDLALFAGVLELILPLPAALASAPNLVGLHHGGTLEGFVEAEDLGVVELELAGADLVADPPLGR